MYYKLTNFKRWNMQNYKVKVEMCKENYILAPPLL